MNKNDRQAKEKIKSYSDSKSKAKKKKKKKESLLKEGDMVLVKIAKETNFQFHSTPHLML